MDMDELMATIFVSPAQLFRALPEEEDEPYEEGSCPDCGGGFYDCMCYEQEAA